MFIIFKANPIAMKNYYALLISLFCISTAYSQDFFNTDNRWQVIERTNPSPERFGLLYVQRLAGSVMVDGDEFRMLQQTTDTTQAIFEDTRYALRKAPDGKIYRHDFQEHSTILLYGFPLPTTGQVWLQGVKAASFYTLYLYTLQGQELYRRQMMTGEGLALPGSMSSGVYQIYNADGRVLKAGKLVRQ